MNLQELKESIDYIERCIVTAESDAQLSEVMTVAIINELVDMKELHFDGGMGSGHWGHSSRDGKRGGSSPGGGISFRKTNSKGEFTSVAQDPNTAAKHKKDVYLERRKRQGFSTPATNTAALSRTDYDAEYKRLSNDIKQAKKIKTSTSAKDIRDIYDKRNALVLRQFKTVDDCDTAADVTSYIKAKGYFRTNSIGSSKVSLSNTDVNVAKDICKSVEAVIEKYPNVKGKMAGITDEISMKQNMYAACAYAVAGNIKTMQYEIKEDTLGTIQINKNYFGNAKKLKDSYDDDVKRGFHPAGTDYRAAITHEIGHALDHMVSAKTKETKDVVAKGGSRTAIGKTYVSREILKQVTKDMKYKNMKTTQGNVSQYAKVNNSEFLAEAFADVMHSSNPKPESVAAITLFEKYIAGI